MRQVVTSCVTTPRSGARAGNRIALEAVAFQGFIKRARWGSQRTLVVVKIAPKPMRPFTHE